MIFTHTPLDGAYLIEPERLSDERGFFARVFCNDEFREAGISFEIAQANVSMNTHRGTVRGMHYQAVPYQEAKCVRCTKGAIYDVIIDIRPESPTFTKWIGIELTDENRQTLFVPEGFAHGFQTLRENTEVFYLMSTPYEATSGRGVRHDDPRFDIDWPVEVSMISEKDNSWPTFDEVKIRRDLDLPKE